MLLKQEYIYREESLVCFSKALNFSFPNLESLKKGNKTLWKWKKDKAKVITPENVIEDEHPDLKNNGLEQKIITLQQ